MNRDRHRLLHIRDAIGRIRTYVTNKEAFLSDSLIQDAVIRNLEVIGEAVKALSEGTRAAAPDVRWSSLAGMRDRLIHGYFSVDLELVWDAVERDLSPIESRVVQLLDTMDE